ncbi:MAG: tryptophan synthase subunit alpha [Fimbriimonadaceae bacterium]|nr:tryptophan synthase subunit alpha [Fimbriimonadaceae bacterium]
MSRIPSVFARLQSEERKALVPYVTGGDPSLGALTDILKTLQDAGADIIEVGIPFSDPIADGPTIQASSQRALDRGVRPPDVIEKVAEAGLEIPVVLMGYMNPILAMGLDRFAASAVAAGVDGVIVCDLTPDEESEPWNRAAQAAGLDRIYLAAPTSTDDRIEAVCRAGTGFVYAVSRTGVTGSENQVPPQVGELVSRIRSRTETPICVGFGISSPQHVSMVCQAADGAVVGSFLVDLLARTWDSPEGPATLRQTVSALKEAAR